MKNFNPVRGTYDYAPKDAKVRENVRRIILNSYLENGYNLIDTPILESLDYLNSSDGGDNLRLMFKTIKRGDKLDLTKPNLTENDIVEEGLRYDLTVPLARFYANNRDKLPSPFKSIQIGSAFRAERPQKGRNRQFTQCDIDIFGDSSINAELDLLNTCIETLNRLGFDKLIVKINDRAILNSLVLFAGFKKEEISSVCITLDKIDKISLTGVTMELIEKGFDTGCINKLIEILDDVLTSGIETTKNYGVDESVIERVKYLIDNLNALTLNKFDIKFDISIVRGQGYYTGTVYEIYTDGFGGAIVGGGRYDKMIEKITGLPTPAVGCSIGFEPVTMLIKEREIKYDDKENLILLYDQDDDILNIFKVKNELKNKYNVSIFSRPKNMKIFYERAKEVANCVTSVKDYFDHKEIKNLI